jgi:hypothetical protein
MTRAVARICEHAPHSHVGAAHSLVEKIEIFPLAHKRIIIDIVTALACNCAMKGGGVVLLKKKKRENTCRDTWDGPVQCRLNLIE